MNLFEDDGLLINATITQRVIFGILCALEVYDKPDFVEWAEGWLSGKDRVSSHALAIRCRNRAQRAAIAGNMDACRSAQSALWAVEAAANAWQAEVGNTDWKSAYEKGIRNIITRAVDCLSSEIDLVPIAQGAMEY